MSPTTFGRVFEENRASLVRVQSRTVVEPGGVVRAPSGGFSVRSERGRKGAEAWVTGFVIGAEGEVVFGASRPPPPKLVVRTDEGTDLDGELLAYDRELQLAVGRVLPRTASSPRLSPLKVASSSKLLPGRWVIVLKHDAEGRAQPFAGTVEVEGERSAKASDKSTPAIVSAPAATGSPVLSTRGELVGVAIEDGRRSARVAAIETLIPFLHSAVLGQKR